MGDVIGIGAGGGGGGGTPGGLSSQVQYNSSGTFAGSTGFTFNVLTDALTVGLLSIKGLTPTRMLGLDSIGGLQVFAFTINTLPKGNSGGTLGDSLLADDGTILRYQGTLGQMLFSSGLDAGIKRVAAGVLQITDASSGAGTLRVADAGGATVAAVAGAANTGTGFAIGSGFVGSVVGSASYETLTASKKTFDSALLVGWGTAATATQDVGLMRSSAGGLLINTGASSGTGGLTLKDLTATAAGAAWVYNVSGTAVQIGTGVAGLRLGADENNFLSFGATPTARIGVYTAETPDTLKMGLPAVSNGIVVCQTSDLGFTHNHPLQVDPTIFVHSHNQSSTEYIALQHDATNGRIIAGTGSVAFLSSGAVPIGIIANAVAGTSSSVTITTVDASEKGLVVKHGGNVRFQQGIDSGIAGGVYAARVGAQSYFSWGNSATADTAGDTFLGRVSAGNVKIVTSSAGLGTLSLGNFNFDRTITGSSATGAVTINQMSGTVNTSAGTTVVIVTNSFVGLNSIVYGTIRTNDATAVIKSIVTASSGAFTINLAAPTGQVSIGFLVTN